MSLSDQLAAAIQDGRKRGPQCRTGRLLGKLEKADVDTLMQALGQGVAYTVIADALKREGHTEVGADSISRHYRGKCSCE